MQRNNVMMDEKQVLLPPSLLYVKYWAKSIKLGNGHMVGDTKKP